MGSVASGLDCGENNGSQHPLIPATPAARAQESTTHARGRAERAAAIGWWGPGDWSFLTGQAEVFNTVRRPVPTLTEQHKAIAHKVHGEQT